jgi:hypothetical protein
VQVIGKPEIDKVFPFFRAAQVVHDDDVINAHPVELVNKSAANESRASGNDMQIPSPLGIFWLAVSGSSVPAFFKKQLPGTLNHD